MILTNYLTGMKILNWKPLTSTKLLFGTGDRITLTVVKNIYVCAHSNCADLPMLNDFEEIKIN